ncbi:MAG: nucleotide exchange factor GrpE [bacterium]|nr:nucleotide exchange factor GrpE [bacterium]
MVRKKKKKDQLMIDKDKLKKIVKNYKLADEYLEHLKRLKAEFDNYKKRVLKEREEIFKYAGEDLINDLLPVIDSLERALSEEAKSHDINVFKEGILLIKKQILDILSRRGLKEIESIGKTLDPKLHHAIMQRDSQEYQEDVIIEELQKGYLLYERVVRPSQVVVVSSGK